MWRVYPFYELTLGFGLASQRSFFMKGSMKDQQVKYNFATVYKNIYERIETNFNCKDMGVSKHVK